MALDRRTFLKGGTAAAAGVALGGPFQGFLARAAGAAGPTIAPPPLAPVADLRDGVLRLALPPGFAYRSFDANPTTMSTDPQDGTTLPGNHDGMGAFKAGGGRVLLIRNHERNGSLGAFTTTTRRSTTRRRPAASPTSWSTSRATVSAPGRPSPAPR